MTNVTNDKAEEINEVIKMFLSLNEVNRTLILSGTQLLVASQEAQGKAS